MTTLNNRTEETEPRGKSPTALMHKMEPVTGNQTQVYVLVDGVRGDCSWATHMAMNCFSLIVNTYVNNMYSKYKKMIVFHNLLSVEILCVCVVSRCLR